MEEYLTTHPTEVKTFTWRIQNFLTNVEVGLPGPSMQFDIGQSLGIPSKWKLDISDRIVTDFQSRHVTYKNLDLKLQEFKEGLRPKHAKCEASLKTNDNPPKDYCSVILNINLSPNSTDSRRLGPLEDIKSRALNADELVIHCKFSLFAEKISTTTSRSFNAKIMMERSQEELTRNLGSLLENGYNSDFVIQVKNSGGKMISIKVHKAILGLRSPVFQRMLDSPMTERETGSMIIEDISAECVKVVLKWIYTGRLDDGWKKIPEEMVNAANKYELPFLLEFLDINLYLVCNLDNAITLGKVAQLHGLKTATKQIADFAKANILNIFNNP